MWEVKDSWFDAMACVELGAEVGKEGREHSGECVGEWAGGSRGVGVPTWLAASWDAGPLPSARHLSHSGPVASMGPMSRAH